MAKETSVGGTEIFSNVPDIESLPPIDGSFNSCWTRLAPSKAANGLPQRFGSSNNFSKYSWNEKRIVW